MLVWGLFVLAAAVALVATPAAATPTYSGLSVESAAVAVSVPMSALFLCLGCVSMWHVACVGMPKPKLGMGHETSYSSSRRSFTASSEIGYGA